MNASARRQKDFFVSPFILRKGAVVQWPSTSFTSKGERFQGEIMSLTRQHTGNIIMTCHNVVSLTTGQLCKPDLIENTAGVQVLSLSYADTLISNPSNSPLFFSNAIQLKDILEAYTHGCIAREKFSQIYKSLNIAQWDENTALDIMDKALESYIQNAWTSKFVGYLDQEWMTCLTSLICLQTQLKRRQPLQAVMLKENVFSIILNKLNTKAFRRHQAKQHATADCHAIVRLPFLPPLSVLRKTINQNFQHLLESRAKMEKVMKHEEDKAMLSAIDDFYYVDYDHFYEDICTSPSDPNVVIQRSTTKSRKLFF